VVLIRPWHVVPSSAYFALVVELPVPPLSPCGGFFFRPQTIFFLNDLLCCFLFFCGLGLRPFISPFFFHNLFSDQTSVPHFMLIVCCLKLILPLVQRCPTPEAPSSVVPLPFLGGSSISRFRRPTPPLPPVARYPGFCGALVLFSLFLLY